MRFLLLRSVVLVAAAVTCCGFGTPPPPSAHARPVHGRYSVDGPLVTVVAPRAQLRLRLATLIMEDSALRCVAALPAHGGMLRPLAASKRPIRFGPRYLYAHVDEVGVDAGGRVTRVVHDAPRYPDRAMHTVANPWSLGDVRYVIDVPAGEAVRDGLVPGRRVRIIASPATLQLEPDHSVPPPLPCRGPVSI